MRDQSRPGSWPPIELTIRFLVLILAVTVITMRLFSSFASSRVIPVDQLSSFCLDPYFQRNQAIFTQDYAAARAIQERYPDCFVEQVFPAHPHLVALIALAILIGIQLVGVPAWKIVRRGLVRLRTEAMPDGGLALRECTTISGVQVRFLLSAGDSRVGGMAFGYPWRRYVTLNRGLVQTAKSDPAVFRSVLLHELAHVRNADIGITALTLATWRAFLCVCVIPAGYLWLTDDRFTRLGEGSLTAIQLLPFVAVAFIARNGVLHAREYLADARSAHWSGDSSALRRVLDADTSRRTRAATLLGLHPRAASRHKALTGVRPPWLTGPFDLLLMGIVTGFAWPSVSYVVHGEVFFDAHLEQSLLALLPLTLPVGLVLATAAIASVRHPGRGVPGLVSIVFAAGVLVANFLTVAESGLAIFPIAVPSRWNLLWSIGLLASCWLLALLMTVMIRSWSWLAARAVPDAVMVIISAGLFALWLAPFLAVRFDLQLIDNHPLSRPLRELLPHMFDPRNGLTTMLMLAVVLAAALFTITGRLARTHAGRRPALSPAALRRPPRIVVVGLLAAALIAGAGTVLWLVSGPVAPSYSDTLIVSLCGTAPPRNSERCHQPIGDSDKLLLVDYIRRYGGSTREYERDGIAYIEVKTSVTGGGPRLAELILARDGVDSVTSP